MIPLAVGITIKQTGNFKHLEKFLRKASSTDFTKRLLAYGEEGLAALREATPVDTGLTAASWSFTLKKTDKGVSLSWNNSNVQNGVPIAIIIDVGHGTNNGGFVYGRNYINPSIQPVFDKISRMVGEELM